MSLTPRRKLRWGGFQTRPNGEPQRSAPGLTGVGLLFKKVFVSDDTGFFFDFSVSLPTPSSGSRSFFFANFDPRFNAKSYPLQKRFPPCQVSNVFHVNNFRGFVRFEIEFPHRDSLTEISATATARSLILRRSDCMSARFANMPVLPMSITVTRFLHGEEYNIFQITMEAFPILLSGFRRKVKYLTPRSS